MKSKNRRYYIVIGLLIIYFIIMFIVFIYPAMKNKKRQIYLLIDNYAKWQYIDGTWSDITDESKYNWKKFDIYEDNTYKGKYYTLFNEYWHFYDDDNEALDFDSSNFLGIISNKKYKIAKFTNKEVEAADMKYVEKVLKEANISTNKFTDLSYFSYDLDNDSKQEKVFTISNIFVEEYTPKIFNFIFVVKDDKITIVSKTEGDFIDMYDNCKMYVNKVVDLNEDNNFEIITGCGYYSDTKNCFEMYEKKGNKYVKIKSCK